MTIRVDDGCALWTETVGDGRPLAGDACGAATASVVVLCHGGPGLWDMFGDVARWLAADAGVAVVRWDQRGCGRSQRCGPYSMARSVADLDAVRAACGVPAVDLLGHSWGATLALAYALTHPDRVRSLVYVSGTGVDPGDPWRPAFHANSEARLGPAGVARRDGLRAGDPLRAGRELAVLQWSAEFVDADRAADHARAMADPWYELNRECSAAVNEDVRGWLPGAEARCRELAVPVLIVDGERDIRPRWAVDSLHRALPRVRRVTLPGAGHLPWVEDPAGFRRVVVEFLAGDLALFVEDVA